MGKEYVKSIMIPYVKYEDFLKFKIVSEYNGKKLIAYSDKWHDDYERKEKIFKFEDNLEMYEVYLDYDFSLCSIADIEVFIDGMKIPNEKYTIDELCKKIILSYKLNIDKNQEVKIVYYAKKSVIELDEEYSIPKNSQIAITKVYDEEKKYGRGHTLLD